MKNITYFLPSQYENVSILFNVVKSLTTIDKIILNYISILNNNFITLWPKQSTMAKNCNISISCLKLHLKKLLSLGLIEKYNRGMNRSCIYKLNTLFNTQSIRNALSKVIPSLAYFTIKFLTQAVINYKKFKKKFANLDKWLQYYRYKRVINRKKSFEKFFGEFMEDHPISLTIRSLKELNLSKWGQIKLAAFPDEAILYAADTLRLIKPNKDIFNWFFKVCYNYCKDNGLTMNFGKSNQLAEFYHMPPNPVYILKKEQVLKRGYVKPSYQQHNTPHTNQHSVPSKRLVPIYKPEPKRVFDKDYEQERLNLLSAQYQNPFLAILTRGIQKESA